MSLKPSFSPPLPALLNKSAIPPGSPKNLDDVRLHLAVIRTTKKTKTLNQTLLSFVRHNIEDLNRRHSVGFDLIQLEQEFPEFKKLILKISKFYKVGKFDRNNADIVPTLEYDGKGGQALIHLECVAADQLLAGHHVGEPVMEVRAANTLVDNAEPEVTTQPPPPPYIGMGGKEEKVGFGGGIRVTLRRLRMM